MPELEQEAVIEITSPSSSLPVSPHILSPISSEVSFSNSSELDIDYGGISLDFYFPSQHTHLQFPLEPTLREILVVQATDTNELESVRKVELQVASFETSIQHIPVYIPFLKELRLDGSCILSLRDLGTDLRFLKILSVARCGLTNLDGMFCLDTLEEFYAQDNKIKDLSPCGFLPYIRVLNFKRNVLTDILTVSFLSVCHYLEHLMLDGNSYVSQLSTYKNIIKSILPNLKSLDGEDIKSEEMITITQSECTTTQIIDCCHDRLEYRNVETESSKKRNTETGQFVVSFPPKILSPRPASSSSSDTSINSSYVMENNFKNC